MKYVFFGTPRFAAIVLEKMIDAGVPPLALVCNPDRPVGRKQIITPPPTKQLMANRKVQIEILQPDDVLTIRDKLLAIRPDVFVVAAYAKILPKEILEIPRLGIIGVHPSLLPKFRGPSPIQSAILAGETETGVSLFLMDEKLDHGPIIAERTITLDSLFAYSYELENRLAEAGAALLLETLPGFVEGRGQSPAYRLPQNESRATYTKRFTSEDGLIPPEDLEISTSGGSPEKAAEIHRKIRALNPEPGVWTIQDGKRVKLLDAKLIDSRLQLTKIQKEGKTPSVLS